jgi:hypothetical protein
MYLNVPSYLNSEALIFFSNSFRFVAKTPYKVWFIHLKFCWNSKLSLSWIWAQHQIHHSKLTTMAEPNINRSLLQFAPMQSSIDEGFWHKLSSLKLNKLGIDDSPIPIIGFFSLLFSFSFFYSKFRSTIM